MSKKRENVKVQPLKPIQISEEERKLRVLGLQLGEVIRQFEIIKASVVNLEKELVRLGKIIQQQQVELEQIKKGTKEKTEN